MLCYGWLPDVEKGSTCTCRGFSVWAVMMMSLLLCTGSFTTSCGCSYATALVSVPVRPYRHRTVSNLALASTSPEDSKLFSANEEAEKLKEQARKLREEIGSFQNEKDDLEEEERRRIQKELDAKQAQVDRYSAIVPILKPDGTVFEEKVQFGAKLCSADEKASTIEVFEANLPLGIILGEHETIPGMTVVDEISKGSNGEASGIQVGDLLRACTACRVEMDQPMWQLMAGGIGRPKTMRYMFGTDFQPFEQVMEAVGSNRLDPEERAVLMVVERKVQ